MREEVGGTITAGERVSAASEMHVQIFSLSLMSAAVGEAVVGGWAGEARRTMPLDVERRLVEFGGIWLTVDINLQWFGEVFVYFAACKYVNI